MSNYACPDDGGSLIYQNSRFYCTTCDEVVDPYSDESVVQGEIVNEKSAYVRLHFDPVVVNIDGEEFFFANKELACEFTKEVEEGHAFTKSQMGEDVNEPVEIEMEPIEMYTDVTDALEAYLS